VMRAIRNITAPQPDGLGISARSVTLSTVGLVSGIEKLMAENLPITLAISLHTSSATFQYLAFCLLFSE